jgi:PAS domain S-box-containing protein
MVLVSLRDQLVRHLERQYDIELAESGEEALEIFEELAAEGIEIPLIISDQLMPGIKGDELLIAIHAQYPKTLKILLTGQASAESVGNAVNAANLYRYIAKPWDGGDLMLTVTEALRRYKQDKQLAEQNAELQQLNASLEQKVADRTAELAAAEAELRGIFAAMTELILVFDAQGRYLKIVSNNPALLSHPSEELRGKTLHEVFDTEPADTFLHQIQSAIATGQVVSFEYSLNLGEQTIWFAANISPISADSAIWVARDITESKLLEEQLRTSEEKIRAIFEAMTDIVLVISEGGEIQVAPTKPSRSFAPELDPISATVEQFFQGENSQVWWEKNRQALTTQQTVSFDYSLTLGEGEVWFSANISPMPNRTTIWVARDISDRKRTEAALRQSEEKFAGAFRSSPSAITITRFQDGRHIEVNDSFCHFTGYSHEEILDRTAVELNLWVNLEERIHLFQILNKNRIIRNYEFEFRTKSGTIKTALLSAELIELDDETCVIAVSQDISDRKQTEAALQEAKEAAEAASLAKSTFLANMSHELRSPLNVILGFSQLLTRSQRLTPEQQENVSIIARSGEHLLALINSVLDLSKIEAGRITFNPTHFDLYRLLDELEDMFQAKADDKGLPLTFTCPPDVPQYIRTDSLKLRQVLINLIGNALKFTESGGVWVRVRPGSRGAGEQGRRGAEEQRGNSQFPLRGSASYVLGFPQNYALPIPNSQFPQSKIQNPKSKIPCPITFEIQDTGKGIAPDELDSLFEAFVQTQSGIDSQEGTGLGLPIARKFVQLMGGDIAVRSQVNQGTTFTFDIQVELVDAATLADTQPTRRAIALAPNQPRYRILIVDDKWSNRQLLIRLLAPLGFDLEEANNGKEAIAVWETFEPHLIWMDMRMPVMDGYEATRQIKAHLKGQATAIIALTASTLEEERAVILSAGCDDFVRKPFREREIFDKIAQYLGVRYVYEDLEAPRTTANPAGASLQDAFAAMPSDWLKAIYQAADSIDNDRLFQLLAQLPESQVNLSQTLSSWVRSFRCDKIIDLIEADERLSTKLHE